MLYLFNTTIMPNEGVYVNRKVNLEKALEIFESFRIPLGFSGEGQIQFTSALGHQGSADAFTSLGFEGVEVNRIQATMQPEDQAIAIKVLGRLPEGAILTLEQLQKVGFEFFHVQMVMGITENPIAFTCEMGGSKEEKTFTAFGECRF